MRTPTERERLAGRVADPLAACIHEDRRHSLAHKARIGHRRPGLVEKGAFAVDVEAVLRARARHAEVPAPRPVDAQRARKRVGGGSHGARQWRTRPASHKTRDRAAPGLPAAARSMSIERKRLFTFTLSFTELNTRTTGFT